MKPRIYKSPIDGNWILLVDGWRIRTNSFQNALFELKLQLDPKLTFARLPRLA